MIGGIHVSTAGGIENAPARLRELGLQAGQVFTASQRRWISPPLSPSGVGQFRELSSGLLMISHASYLINLASADPLVVQKSRRCLKEELERCSYLGIRFLVMHPGAHQKQGVAAGTDMVARALDEILPSVEDAPILLLENTAGAGTMMGSTLEELNAIRQAQSHRELTGFCIDTAHAHGAGYQVGSENFADAIEVILGLVNVRAFHLNDSMVPKGSLRDRHQHFSLGSIGLENMLRIWNDENFKHVPGIAETPGTDGERAADIRMLMKGRT